MNFTPYVIPLLIGAILLLGMAFYALRFKELKTARIFSLLMGLAAIWSVNQALEISTSLLPLKVLLDQLRNTLNAFLAPAELAMVLAYTGRSRWLNDRRSGLILVIPLASAFLSLTSNFHKFFRYDYRLDKSGTFPVLLKTNAFGYYFYLSYNLVLLGIALILLLAALRDKKLDIRITLCLFLGVFIPLLAELLYTFGITPIRGYDLASSMFVITGILYVWALLRYRLFSVAPVARRIVVDNIVDVVIVLDSQDKIVDFNPAAQSACALSPRSIGTATDSLLQTWAELFQRFRQVAQFKGEVSLEMHPGLCTYDLTISTIQDEHNRVAGRLFLFHDLTERKQAEDTLRQSEERFRELADNAPLAIVVSDWETGEMVYANAQMAELFEIPVEQLLGSSTRDRYANPHERDDFLRLLREQKQVHDYEVCVKKGDGHEFWVSLTGIISSFAGRPAIQAAFSDITQRKQAEIELRESEEKFRSLFEGHTSVMVLTDPETSKIVDANPSACRFYGYSHLEMVGMDISAINCLTPAEIKASMDEAQQEKNNHFTFPHRLANGEIRTVQIDSSAIIMNGKHVLFSIIRDITEQKKMESELVESQKMADIGMLAAGIAHEINSPLQVITGYSDSLIKALQEDGKLDGERPDRQLKTINRNAWRMAEIVRSLQNYAHSKQGIVSPNDLNLMVKDTLILMEHQLKTWSKITIQTYLAEDLPLLVCDQNKIIQVLINLLSNARDAMPNGGTISIDTAFQLQPERLVLRVADNGEGMPEAVCARIFDPFFTTKSLGKGTGLGLPIVQGIVRAHGGEIQVKSVLNQGTTFTISLPLTQAVQ